MQVKAGTEELDGQGAAMLSFRSQTKPIVEVLSFVASEGKLDKRQPDPKEKIDKMKLKFMEFSLKK